MGWHRSSQMAFGFALVTLFVPPLALAQRSESTVSTEKIFDAIEIREGATVCEIGAGDGNLSLAAARRVGPGGRVYTSELGDSRVRSLEANVDASGLEHITVVAGDPAKTNFPDASCDALFMRNVYHHFQEPLAMDRSIAAAMKAGARVAVVDFTPRGAEASRPADRDNDGTHGVRVSSVEREMTEAGFQMVSSQAGEDRWFMVVFAKPKG